MDQGLSSELESVKAENEQFLVLARREGRGAYIVRQVSTFEEAFRMLRHEPYLYYLREQLGLTPSREYQAISMSLAQCQAIPWGVNLPLEAIFGLRLNQWRREGLSFSEGLELVQFHRVNRREQLVMTTHVGVLMQRNDGRITYIEKVGPTGPFVRVDMDCRAEILERAGLLDVPGGPYEYFVSINDAFLGESWPKSLLPHRVIEGHGYYRHASMNCWTNAISLNTSRLAGTDRLRHNGR
jgi:hypothetical protein